MLFLGRKTEVTGCGSEFAAPGEVLVLRAEGFAADAAVSFEAKAATALGTVLADPVLAGVTADSDGVMTTEWTVPAAPAASVDAVPRGYAMRASGSNSEGGTHTTYMIEPVIAYPGAKPCAKPDTATVSWGSTVQVSLLANDVAPAGGSLDASTVELSRELGGSFTADAATGAVTFVPEVGFRGTARAEYVVFDGWGLGVESEVTVTVSAGCTITGTSASETIVGTEGDDVLCVPDPDDWVSFWIMDGKGGDDVIVGGDGEEWIYGGDGDDTIHAGGGDDFIVAGSGVDTIYGGAGMDEIHSVDLVDTVIDDPDGYTLVVAPAVAIGPEPPVANPDWHYAEAGEIMLIDVLANDQDVNGDLAMGSVEITKAPKAGIAHVVVGTGGAKAVEYIPPADGGIAEFAYQVCDALFQCASAQVTVMSGTEACTIVGTEGNDNLRGTSGDDVICGLGGNDTLLGFDGDDILIGGDGADVLWGGAGDDALWGGGGSDKFWGGFGNDQLWGGAGDDLLHGNEGDDLIMGGLGADEASGGDGNDDMWGGPGADNLVSNDGNDRLGGGPGSDTLWSGAGDDTMWGQTGNDTLHGNVGDDVMFGGFGNDTLYAGPGTDYADGGHNFTDDTRPPDTDTCTAAETTRHCEPPAD